MNTSFKDNSYIKIFLPDPWNHQNKVKPEELKNFYSLPREYAQNYTNFSLTSNFIEILKLIAFLIKELISNLIFLLPRQIFFEKGIKNTCFFLFDVISLKIFQNRQKNNLNFSPYLNHYSLST